MITLSSIVQFALGRLTKLTLITLKEPEAVSVLPEMVQPMHPPTEIASGGPPCDAIVLFVMVAPAHTETRTAAFASDSNRFASTLSVATSALSPSSCMPVSPPIHRLCEIEKLDVLSPSTVVEIPMCTSSKMFRTIVTFAPTSSSAEPVEMPVPLE